MDPLLISAASGMKARMESLDLLANNIANSGTSGFKADREFYSLVQDQLPVIERNWTDFSQGTLVPTNNQLDLGLSGAGFFALNTPSGVVYTRNGQFQTGKNNQLQTADGYSLRNARDQGRPITVDPRIPIGIAKNGAVEQGGQQIGQLEIAGLGTPASSGASSGTIATLAKQGNSYFRMAAPGTALGMTAPPAEASTEVLQGTLEQSNVPAADAAVRLVSIMRQFEMLQHAVTIGADMDKQAITDVARVI
jgi:flagellar basal-body rod protein FlgF